ncbi:MAG: molybdopterin-binding protein [Halarcobacter sp.]
MNHCKNLIKNSLDADLIVTSGGVSVGDADFTNDAFLSLDFKPIFRGIEIKPGKPTIFGKIENTFILNLPGNPLAASALFLKFLENYLFKNFLVLIKFFMQHINAKLAN